MMLKATLNKESTKMSYYILILTQIRVTHTNYITNFVF